MNDHHRTLCAHHASVKKVALTSSENEHAFEHAFEHALQLSLHRGHLFSSVTTGLYLTFKFRAVFDRLCQLYGGALPVRLRPYVEPPPAPPLAFTRHTLFQRRLSQPMPDRVYR